VTQVQVGGVLEFVELRDAEMVKAMEEVVGDELFACDHLMLAVDERWLGREDNARSSFQFP